MPNPLAGGALTPATLASRLASVIINPLLLLLFGIAMLVFVYGIVEFILNLAQGGEKLADGKMHMFYGVLGMFVMVSAYALFSLIQNTVNSF